MRWTIAGALVLGTLSRPVSGAEPPTLVRAEIDFADTDVAAQAEALATALAAAGPVIYLDLTIRPALTEGEADYRVSVTPRGGGETAPLRCESERLENASEFGIELNPDYNNLLLTVRHLRSELAPFSTASCAVSGYPFRIYGYYAVSLVDIPTARDIELRPVSPSFEMRPEIAAAQ